MSEVVVDAIADRDVPQTLVETFTPIVDESKIHFDDDGVHMRAVDAANVAMTYADLGTAAFEAYDSPGSVTVGANLNAIDDRLAVADADDVVNLAIDMETRKLSVDVGHIDQQVALIGPDSIRQEPDDPDLDLPNTVTLTGADLGDVVTVADMVSDHVELHGDPDGECVRFVAVGDTDESAVEFGNGEVVDANVTGATESIFTTGYVEQLATPIPDDAEVEITFGDEMPMYWEWTAADGHLSVTQMLAPRIQRR